VVQPRARLGPAIRGRSAGGWDPRSLP
jgi:hypothetical protein